MYSNAFQCTMHRQLLEHTSGMPKQGFTQDSAPLLDPRLSPKTVSPGGFITDTPVHCTALIGILYGTEQARIGHSPSQHECSWKLWQSLEPQAPYPTISPWLQAGSGLWPIRHRLCPKNVIDVTTMMSCLPFQRTPSLNQLAAYQKARDSKKPKKNLWKEG